MSDLDPLVSAALDAQVPLRPDRLPDWDDVLARARVTGPQQAPSSWLPRGHRRRVMLAFALVVVGVIVTGSALAALGYHPLGGLRAPAVHKAAAGHRPGSLDTSFGRGGKVMGTIGASALAIEKDGKLVAAGTSNTGPIAGSGSDAGENRFALVRYNANGTLDGSFGRGGKVTTPIVLGEGDCLGGPPTGGAGASASALAIQKDGKLVAAGGGSCGRFRGGDFALARYNANGTLDGSFGRGGIVTTPTGGASALAIQKDGKLVAAGGSDNGFALVRYNANGSLDGSFGRGGIVTTPVGSGAGASVLAIQQDGKLVAAGSSRNGHVGVFALVRYNANGTLDKSFGRGGKVTTPIIGRGADADRPYPSLSALLIQQDGRLVAAGSSQNGSDGVFALVRYNANGTLDRSFGRGGKVTTMIGPGAGANALAIQQDGKLVAAGERRATRSDGPGGVFALVRYNANGALDGSFGRGGIVTTPLGGASALAIQQDGKLVAAGGGPLVRYWSSPDS